MRLSLRFLPEQGSVGRLSDDRWNGNAYPFLDQTGARAHPLVAQAARDAKQPHFLWFSHGLWRLPTSVGPCRLRFKAESSAFQRWQTSGTRVVWQSQPRVRVHPPHPGPNYTKEDTACARESALRVGASFLDTWQYTWVPSGTLEEHNPVMQNDVHLFDFALHGIIDGVLLPQLLNDLEGWLWTSAQ